MKRVKFKGWFSYQDSNFVGGERIVYFHMDVIDNKGNFEGTATDDETREAFKDEVITVKGFFDDGIISFLKNYPNNYTGTNHYQVEVDHSRKNHVVEYMGTWDDMEHKFVGTYAGRSDFSRLQKPNLRFQIVASSLEGYPPFQFYIFNW